MSSAELRCIFPSLPRTNRGEFTVLGADPKNENFLYCNGQNVYIRDLNNPSKCDIYSEHTKEPVVAEYSPTRFYICSGDKGGKVRIWDTINAEHILKNEFQVLGGMVKAVGWTPDSQKIGVGGEGREFYGKVITMDSGNTVGDPHGHSKSINSLAFKPTRPFRMATASEDFTVQFLEGPPFKVKQALKHHSNFVNCIRYSPTGDVFISGGHDGLAVVYDGKTSEKIGTLGEKTHNGGIYGLSFSPDGKEVLTVSGDKTAKIWDVESRQNVVTFKMGENLSDMQVGCLWSGDYIMTLSLSGYINYLDRNNPSTPIRIQKGHNKTITSLVVDGTSCEAINDKSHTNQVIDMVIDGDTLITVGIDDTCRYSTISTCQYNSKSCPLPSQPRKVSSLSENFVVVACIKHIVVVDDGTSKFQQEVKWEPTCVDVHCNKSTVAFGSTMNEVHIFEYIGGSLTGKQKIKVEDDVINVKFSPDGAYLVVITGSKRNIKLYSVGDNFNLVNTSSKQTGKLFSVAWCPNSQYLATGSLDGSIVVWNLNTKLHKNIEVFIREAHKKGNVQCLQWLSNNVLLSAGNDCCIKQWNIKYE
ncbi:WD repeat-containing protein 1 [Mactra antiquata]